MPLLSSATAVKVGSAAASKVYAGSTLAWPTTPPTPTPTFTNTAEGQATGTVPTTGNTGGGSGDAFQTVALAAGGCTFSNAQAFAGNNSYNFNASATGASTLGWTFTGTPSAASRAYLRLGQAPTAALDVMVFRSSGNAMKIQLQASTARILVQNTSGTTIYAGATPELGTWYRVEIRVVPGSGATDGTIAYALFAGASTTPIDTYSATDVNAGTALITGARYGHLNSGPTADIFIDEMACTAPADNMIGP